MDNIPTFERDERGLIKGLLYHFDIMGRINWRKMLLPQHLYVSPEHQTQVMVQQNVKSKWDVDVTKCEDKELLVTLAGLKYLARIRGIQATPEPVLHVSVTDVTCSCSIQFIPNFEDLDGIISSGVGCASLYSVSGKFQLYLGTMAHNRAYTRAVRDALGIEILGFEEVDFKASKAFEKALEGGKNPIASNITPVITAEEPASSGMTGFDGNALLSRRCAELDKNGSHSFEKIKEHAITVRADLTSDPATWTEWSSIPRLDSFTLLNKVNEAAEKKGKKK